MNKLFGIKYKNINDINEKLNINIFNNQKIYKSINLLLINNNEPFIKYDCQTKYVLIYNGELLNKDELRCKLRTLGFQFKTELDEEVILNSYIYYKENCFNHFKGAYSIIIYTSNKVIIARDKLGVKPIFYSLKDDNFIFSNEIKSLLKSNLIEPIVNEDGLKELFTMSPSFTPSLTPFKDIKMVKPGEYIIYEDNLLSKVLYYKLPIYKYSKSYKEAKYELKELLNKSINRLIHNKDDYGALLSGGIDSSIVALLANKINLDTYFLEYNNNDLYFKKNDFQRDLDKKYALIMSKYLNSNMEILSINEEELFNNLISSLKARDLPGMGDIDSSLYWLCNNINNKNILTGECSDEILGGYPWYYRDKEESKLPWLRNIEFRENILKDEFKNLNLNEYLDYSYNELIKDYEECSYDNIEDKKWRKLTYINIYSFMQQLLYRQEMMTTNNNINALSPFIDIDLVEFCYNLPSNYKYKDNKEKCILKEAFYNDLPFEITNRIKNPYPKTFSPIYKNMLINKIKEYLSDSNSTINKFYKKEEIEKLINEESNIPFYGQLMTETQFLAYLVQFEEWVKLYNIKFKIKGTLV